MISFDVDQFQAGLDRSRIELAFNVEERFEY